MAMLVDAFRSMLGGLIESGMENPLERQAKFDEHMGQVQENIRVTKVRTSFNPRQDWNGTKWVSRTRFEEMNGRHLSDSAAILSQMENDYGSEKPFKDYKPQPAEDV